MVEPRVIPREAHTLSRRDIDSDALKVLYRLRQGEHIAYLVGGSVRDLLLNRRPKDFDIGTSAHPYQVKKLFRNCWIIGRRFRLAHVKFGTKVIEVATFRRQVQPGEEIVQDGVPAPAIEHHEPRPLPGTDPGLSAVSPVSADDQVALAAVNGAAAHGAAGAAGGRSSAEGDDHVLHRDNTFGTPEEDAFRRDFTINALFYDIANFSIIDYVGGLDDLREGLVRCIGVPEDRMREDPVRMMRAVALAARLDFRIEQPILDAIGALRHEIAKSAAPRILEEYYKILRNGSAEKTFRELAALGLLEPISEELHKGAGAALWESLTALDRYRQKFPSTPETMSNAILLGALLVPLGMAPQPGRPPTVPVESEGKRRKRPRLVGPKLGALPLARRDLERLRQLLGLQRRLRDLGANVRNQRALTHRGIFREALTWLEIFDGNQELVDHWITVLAERGAEEPPLAPGEAPAPTGTRKRRRRRRRRYRPAP
jgi:poly(A) polymerase